MSFKAQFQGEEIECTSIYAFADHGADSTIIFCAHYDHLGMGHGKSKEIRKQCIHPGADDNASGVALMLEMAREVFSKRQNHSRYNYLFLAPSAHEIGLFGSKEIVKSGLLDSLKIKLLINMDMVGRLSRTERRVRINHCGVDSSTLSAFAETDNLRITKEPADAIHNDLTVFCEAGIPSISITTGLHDDYHRCSDTADKINYEGILRIRNYLTALIVTQGGLPTKPR